MTRQHTSKARVRMLAFLLIVAFMFGYAGAATLAATADPNPDGLENNTASISMGSSLFTGTRYYTIAAHEDGLSLRINELFSNGEKDKDGVYTSAKEYATATFTSEVYMNNFFVNLKINDTIFDELTLVFKYDYVQGDVWDYTPAQQRQTIKFVKTSDGKISASVNDGSAVAVGSDFASTSLSVKFEGNTVKVNDTTVGTAKEFPTKRAQFEIQASELNVSKLESDTDKQKASLYLTEMGYDSNVTLDGADKPETIRQTFKSESKVKDTSRPIARLDKEKLPTYVKQDGTKETYGDNNQEYYYATRSSTVTVPVTGMDMVKSSITTSIEVKYAETYDGLKDVSDEDADVRKTNTFEPDAKGYYAVTKITVSDGKNKIILGEGDSVDGVTLPIVYKAFADEYKPELQNYTANFDKLGTLIGGSNNKFQLPYPKMGASFGNGVQLVEQIGYDEATDTKYYADNAKALSYTIMYKSPSASSYSSSAGLTFTASSTGDYVFYLRVADLKGKKTTDETSTFWLGFRDRDELMITVSSFPAEKYVNQSVSLPSGSVIEGLGSTSSTIKVYLMSDKDGNELWNCEWQYELKSDGSFKKDSDGNKILVLDKNGYRIPAVYTYKDGENVDPAFPKGAVIYLDEDGERIPYQKVNGKDECPDRVHEIVSASTSFTPKYRGNYRVEYSAKDTAGNEAQIVVRSFSVTDAPKSTTSSNISSSGIHLNTMSIVFLSIAGACAIGIVLLLVIKPKSKEEDEK